MPWNNIKNETSGIVVLIVMSMAIIAALLGVGLGRYTVLKDIVIINEE